MIDGFWIEWLPTYLLLKVIATLSGLKVIIPTILLTIKEDMVKVQKYPVGLNIKNFHVRKLT